jgi:L-fuconolactonase
MQKQSWPPVSRSEWLASNPETPIDSEIEIIDPHIHLWDSNDESRYLYDELRAELRSGHNIVGCIFVECGFRDRGDGPSEMAPVEETAAVAGIARARNDVDFSIMSIIGAADLSLGHRAGKVLDAHIEAGQGLFSGIRCRLTFDNTGSGLKNASPASLMSDPIFGEGVREVSRRDLILDSWLYFSQLAEFFDLARSNPECTFVLNHAGGILGVGIYAGRRDEVIDWWQLQLTRLAELPNVFVKVGGLGQSICGFDFENGWIPPSSDDLLVAWGAIVNRAIDTFGTDRCMLESNFPPDRNSVSYVTLWNGFKKITSGYSASERSALFGGTARSVYSIH